MIDSRYFRDECYINGEWVGGGGKIEVVNPATGKVIGSTPRFGRAETAKAIDAAHAAFPAWRARSAAERADYCRKIFEALMANQNDLARLLTVEMGKPFAEAKGEIAYAANFFRWFGEEARRIYGDIIPAPWGDKRIIVTKEPAGVVGSITPWNFPTAMIARKAAAALATGCTIVCKPASQTPYSALAYGVIADEVGLPKGVLNVITGSAGEIADEMCENPKLRKITFTGSTEVGRKLIEAAAHNVVKPVMELGGNAPFLVFEDADHRLDAVIGRLLPELVGPEDEPVVGRRERGHPHPRGGGEQVVDAGGTVEHRVFGVIVQMGESRPDRAGGAAGAGGVRGG